MRTEYALELLGVENIGNLRLNSKDDEQKTRLINAMADRIRRDRENRLRPFSDTWTTVALNAFQIGAHAISMHYDPGDMAGELNVVIPFGNFQGGHFYLPEFRAVVEVRAGEALFFSGRRTAHGTYLGHVRGVRSSLNGFTHENLLQFVRNHQTLGSSARAFAQTSAKYLFDSLIKSKKQGDSQAARDYVNTNREQTVDEARQTAGRRAEQAKKAAATPKGKGKGRARTTNDEDEGDDYEPMPPSDKPGPSKRKRSKQ